MLRCGFSGVRFPDTEKDIDEPRKHTALRCACDCPDGFRPSTLPRCGIQSLALEGWRHGTFSTIAAPGSRVIKAYFQVHGVRLPIAIPDFEGGNGLSN